MTDTSRDPLGVSVGRPMGAGWGWILAYGILTLLVAIWLGVRGVMELAFGARLRRGRGWMIALGIVNILLALYVFATLPLSALALPGFILGISFLLGGVTAIVAASSHRQGAAAFSVPA